MRARINVPLYAFETDLTNGRVSKGAERAGAALAHPDLRGSTPTSARATSTRWWPQPSRNRFLRTVVPFLKVRAR